MAGNTVCEGIRTQLSAHTGGRTNISALSCSFSARFWRDREVTLRTVAAGATFESNLATIFGLVITHVMQTHNYAHSSFAMRVKLCGVSAQVEFNGGL